MSRYALFAGDMITLLPLETAATRRGGVRRGGPQNWGTPTRGRVAFAMSCQPIAVLPVAATMGSTLFSNVSVVGRRGRLGLVAADVQVRAWGQGRQLAQHVPMNV